MKKIINSSFPHFHIFYEKSSLIETHFKCVSKASLFIRRMTAIMPIRFFTGNLYSLQSFDFHDFEIDPFWYFPQYFRNRVVRKTLYRYRRKRDRSIYVCISKEKRYIQATLCIDIPANDKIQGWASTVHQRFQNPLYKQCS